MDYIFIHQWTKYLMTVLVITFSSGETCNGIIYYICNRAFYERDGSLIASTSFNERKIRNCLYRQKDVSYILETHFSYTFNFSKTFDDYCYYSHIYLALKMQIISL